MRLTSDEVAQFRDQGYLLHKEQVLPADDFARLKGIFEQHLASGGDLGELDMPHARDPRLLEFLLSDHVLDLVEPITGPDVVLWSSGFISKQPHTGAGTPWHEDSAYWQGKLDSYEAIVTIWLAMDRSSSENGCLRVIPGTHLSADSTYRVLDPSAFFTKEIEAVDESKAVYFELSPGECSLHDGRIMHGAAANTSPYRRGAYTMRYLPATTRVSPELSAGHPVWLARGRAIASNAYRNA